MEVFRAEKANMWKLYVFWSLLKAGLQEKHGCSLVQKQVLVSIPNFPSNILFMLQKVRFAY